jgi:hypothetical protein
MGCGTTGALTLEDAWYLGISEKPRSAQHPEPFDAPGLRGMKNRPARDGAQLALQVAQTRDRILDLSCPAFDKATYEIARNQTHAMHPYSYRAIGEKAL